MIISAQTEFRLQMEVGSTAIQHAIDDLKRDFEKVLGRMPLEVDRSNADLRIKCDPALDDEAWEIVIGDGIDIRGGGDLGVVYALYEVSHSFLGVDPMWFWKGIEPTPRSRIEIQPGVFRSQSGYFRWRGWFINDEDLLGGWVESGHQRFMHWPRREATLGSEDPDFYEKRLLGYYSPIVAHEVMEAVYEASLRQGCNLIIPASFIDVMNPAEAELVEAAVARGLYVSQHHVEPLGVSHFAYETWWDQQGETPSFSYRDAPESMLACWRAYAERWWAIAGEQVIWQVGLRGRGDRPLWHHDPDAKARAGEFISAALDAQMQIVRALDSRDNVPATMTLWLEGAELIESGELSVPDGVTLVFADDDLTQEMRSDFEQLPREAGRTYGVYYHLAVWGFGPHLAQGVPPEKIARVVQSVAGKGDSEYAIVNVANLREHCLGATVWSEQLRHPEAFNADRFFARVVPDGTADLYAKYFAAIPVIRPGWGLHDGCARTLLNMLLRQHFDGHPLPEIGRQVLVDGGEDLREKVDSAIRLMTQLLKDADELLGEMSEAEADFFKANFIVQLSILRGLYHALRAMMGNSPDSASAAEGLEKALAVLPLAEKGKWRHWYRGDLKVGLNGLVRRLRSAVREASLSEVAR